MNATSTTVTCPRCGKVVTVPVGVDAAKSPVMRFTPDLTEARKHVASHMEEP